MSANQLDPRETAARLLAYLRQLKNDRGAMADLRCALSPARLPRAWPLLARVGGIGNPLIEAVAGLFAYHPTKRIPATSVRPVAASPPRTIRSMPGSDACSRATATRFASGCVP